MFLQPHLAADVLTPNRRVKFNYLCYLLSVAVHVNSVRFAYGTNVRRSVRHNDKAFSVVALGCVNRFPINFPSVGGIQGLCRVQRALLAPLPLPFSPASLNAR